MNEPVRSADIWPDWHYQPLRLKKAEIEKPMEVIKEFFSGYHLPEVRKHFKEMLEDATCAVEVYAINYLTLYDNIEKLIEAAWLLLKREEKAGITPPAGDETIASVLQIIIAAIHPERIFLLSYEEHRLADVLIVVPDSSAKPFSYYETLVAMAFYAIPEVSFSLHQSSQVKKHLTDAHPFYVFACTEEKQVYSGDSTAFSLPDHEQKETAKEAARQTFGAGFLKGTGFFETAKVNFENGNFAIAMFALQQAAELSLRALIRALTGTDVKEHSLTVLARHLRRCAPLVAAYLVPGNAAEKARIALLESAYLDGRYSDRFTPQREDVLPLLQWVDELRDTCEEAFANTMAAFIKQ